LHSIICAAKQTCIKIVSILISTYSYSALAYLLTSSCYQQQKLVFHLHLQSLSVSNSHHVIHLLPIMTLLVLIKSPVVCLGPTYSSFLQFPKCLRMLCTDKVSILGFRGIINGFICLIIQFVCLAFSTK